MRRALAGHPRESLPTPPGARPHNAVQHPSKDRNQEDSTNHPEAPEATTTASVYQVSQLPRKLAAPLLAH